MSGQQVWDLQEEETFSVSGYVHDIPTPSYLAVVQDDLIANNEDRDQQKPTARVSRRRKAPAPATPWEDDYLSWMEAEGIAVETMRQRIYLLRGLGKHPEDVRVSDIVEILNARDLSQHSKAAYITVYKTVFSDLLRMGMVQADPTAMLRTPKTPRRSPRPLSSEQLARLETLSIHRPEHAWTILGAYAGLRVGEVCSITGQALQYRSSGAVLCITGKGGLTADIPAHPKVLEVMKPHEGNPEAIWPMWPQSMNRAWQKAAKWVGVEDVVFHQLRHSFATRLTRAGVDLLVIADLCRHSSVATTQRYAKVADDAPFQAVVGL